jgi:hypothetical protein
LLWNANIWSQYHAGTSASTSEGNTTISEWVNPTLGFLLREALPGQPRWAMFVPLLIAIPMVVGYWWKKTNRPFPVDGGDGSRSDALPAAKRGDPFPQGERVNSVWNWSHELPRLVLVSLICAPYGAWGFDLVLLLVPVLHAASWLVDSPQRKLWLYAYIAFNVVCVLTLFRTDSMTNYWITPVVVFGYITATLSRAPKGSALRWLSRSAPLRVAAQHMQHSS